jgi:hypothetical protein
MPCVKKSDAKLARASTEAFDMTESQGLIAGILLALALGIYTFWPDNVFANQHEKTRLEYLLERKDQLYENLRDLNFEYRVGKYRSPARIARNRNRAANGRNRIPSATRLSHTCQGSSRNVILSGAQRRREQGPSGPWMQANSPKGFSPGKNVIPNDEPDSVNLSTNQMKTGPQTKS